MVTERDIWNAIGAHLQETFPSLDVNTTAETNRPFISVTYENCHKSLLFMAGNQAPYKYYDKHDIIDLDDPNLLDHIKETIQKWLQERNDP